MKKLIPLLMSIALFSSCVKTNDEKADNAATDKQAGTYNLMHYKLVNYDFTTGLPHDSTERDNVGTTKLTIDPDYLSLNPMVMKWDSISPRLLYRLNGYLDVYPDNSLGCYWIPDIAEKRLLIYGLSGGGSEYVQVNLNVIDSKHQRWTYIETATGYDGQATGGTMRVKEVYEMEKE